MLAVKDRAMAARPAWRPADVLDGCARRGTTAAGNPAPDHLEFHIMANWYGNGRSNYVRVKDRAAFLAWARSIPDVEVVEKDNRFAFLVTGDGMWPTWKGDDVEQAFDLAAEIAAHLANGEVFIFQEVGAEKLRYLTGWAKAVNDAGDTLQVSIDDIYEFVRERWKVDPTEAQG